MTLTRCESETSATARMPAAFSNEDSAGSAKLGRIVPDTLLGALSGLGARTGWPLGPFETAATLVEALARALEARDPCTHGHSIRVAQYAMRIAAEMGLPPAVQEEIRVAGALHDIGKIGIEDELLKSDGALNDEQYRRILDHTVIGERILQPLFGHRPVIFRVARWHHEWFDGAGSPDGLAGDIIPLSARIVAVADAFDAMTSARPYRAPLPLTVATWELASGAGIQFDPECVAALLKSNKDHVQGSPVFSSMARRFAWRNLQARPITDAE